ncbi:DUF4062 domain-containing protein [Frankia sp. Mgl5]|uniref:WD40 domain-containing protein n=1 Tax=Frankia sp. Mgl5 TaxID=2933793 RepID=UPI0027E4CE2D|nr:DUF4062 domain-containing protein [Frankia sp. Mgl5]
MRVVAGRGTVFISHTSDMAAFPRDRSFVQAAVEAVLRAEARPVDMAQFAARGQPPAEYCQQQVRKCDVYLAVVGFRYGSRVPGEPDGVSYTELEFNTATAAGLPRLVFLLDEEIPVPRSLVDRDGSAVDGFRERLRQAEVIVKTVATPDELGEAVLHALYELRRHGHRPAGDETAQRHREPGTGGGPTAQRRPWMAPPLDRMVERPELGDQLIAALHAPGPTEAGLITALQGAGGFGKTTLATWACHRMEIDRRFPGGLLWVTLGQEVDGAGLAERVNDLAFVLTGSRPAISDPNAAGAELGRLLDEREPVLLVVDDVWASQQLRPFRIGGRVCTRLVTTRIPEMLPPDGPRITVDVMSGEQARNLVIDGVGGLPAGAVDRLATVAGRWPVLLNLVNGVLRRKVARGQQPGLAAEEILRLLAAHGPAALDPARPSERARAVAATVEASLGLTAPSDRECYLSLAIFPEDVDIPLNVLALLWPGRRLDTVCENLTGLGLVADYRLDPPGPRLVLHDVIRAYLRQHVDDQAGAHARLVDAAAGLLPGPAEDGRTPWWRLPEDLGYLWRFLPRHLAEAGRHDDLVTLVTDLRWVEARTRRMGSAVGVVADLDLAATPLSVALAAQLRLSDHLLGPIDPPTALGAILASRLHGLPDLGTALERYRATLPLPRLEPAWPPPERPDPTRPGPPAAGHAGGIYSCAFSAGGGRLATASDDGTVQLWNITEASPRAVFTGHTGAVWACTFSPDDTLLATASADHSVRLWDLADGSARSVLAHPGPVTGCAFSPDGTVLATTGQDGAVRLWEVAGGHELRALAGHDGDVWGCAFSPGGRLLATVGSDRSVRLWNVADGSPARVLDGHQGAVRDCVFSPDGTVLATVSDDQTARIWNIADGGVSAVLAAHTSRVWGCAFSPDGRLLATTGYDGTARLWNLTAATERAVLTGHGGSVRGCAFSPDGTMLATTSHDQTVRIWNVADASVRAVLTGQTSRATTCAFSPDGSLLATATIDGAVQLRRLADQVEVASFDSHAEGIRGCAFSPDGALLATTGNDGTARLWELPGGREKARLTGHTGWVRTCAFSPDGTMLATSGQDWTARVWNVADGDPRVVFIGHKDVVYCCAFSPDGMLIATTSSDGTVRLWNAADGTESAVLNGHTDAPMGCVFSPDGSLLATTSDDHTARLWEVATGRVIHTLAGHTHWVECCAFSPDGTVLATAGSDGMIRIWDVADGRCRCALRVTGPLLWIAWHPDGTVLAAAGGAGTHLLAYVTGPVQSSEVIDFRCPGESEQ